MKSEQKIVALLLLLAVSLISVPAQTSKASSTKFQNSGWQRIRLDGFSISLPQEMKNLNARGYHSQVWSFGNDRLLLDIETGQYAGFNPYYRKKEEYQEETVKAGKATALMCFYKLEEPLEDGQKYAQAIFFSENSGAKFNLVIVLFFKSVTDREIAKQIFSTIKFIK